MKRFALWKSLLVTLLVGFSITACNQSPASLAQPSQNTAQPRRVVPNPIPITPDIIFQHTGNAFQGTPYPIRARIRNAKDCVNTTWEVDAPDTLDTLLGTTGCDQEVTFETAGIREVRVSTINWRGQTVSATLKIEVHTYPWITSATFYTQGKYVGSNGLVLCRDFTLLTGDLIGLWSQSCVSDHLSTKFAVATIENPTNETLTYDWKILYSDPVFGPQKLFEELDSSEPKFEIPVLAKSTPSIQRLCSVTLTVNAPDPTRSKTALVWSGQCVL